MRLMVRFPALLLGVGLLGAGLAAAPTAALAAPTQAKQAKQAKLPRKAVCAVCGVREHAGAEAVAASAEYNGKTYYFCKEACKTEFLQDPQKWVSQIAEQPAHEEHSHQGGAGAAPS